jgi:hypothetical protein
MQRTARVVLTALDTVLVLAVLVYGALILLVILRPWQDDLPGLLLGHSPEDLLIFVAGVLCLAGVPIVFLRRRLSGIMWVVAILAVEFSAALRQLRVSPIQFDITSRVWLYAVLSFAALVIFIRFVYPSRGSSHVA